MRWRRSYVALILRLAVAYLQRTNRNSRSQCAVCKRDVLLPRINESLPGGSDNDQKVNGGYTCNLFRLGEYPSQPVLLYMFSLFQRRECRRLAISTRFTQR